MKLYSFLKGKFSKFSKLPEPIPVLSMVKPNKPSELPGVELGIPLNIFQYISTYNHYGYSIINPQLILMQFFIGFYTYGKDRYYDAISANLTGIGYDSKKDLYDFILKNKKLLKEVLDFSFYTIVLLITLSDTNDFKLIDFLSSNDFQLSYQSLSTLVSNLHIEQKIPFIAALLTTEYYSNIKEKLGFLKAVYVASMWTMSSVILPSVLYEHNFDILNSPLDYFPIFAIIFSSSNLLDIKDASEDEQNGIYTLPVLFGVETSKWISIITIAISSILIFFNGIYSPGEALDIQKIILNIIIEIQNLTIMINSLIAVDKKNTEK